MRMLSLGCRSFRISANQSRELCKASRFYFSLLDKSQLINLSWVVGKNQDFVQMRLLHTHNLIEHSDWLTPPPQPEMYVGVRIEVGGGAHRGGHRGTCRGAYRAVHRTACKDVFLKVFGSFWKLWWGKNLGFMQRGCCVEVLG